MASCEVDGALPSAGVREPARVGLCLVATADLRYRHGGTRTMILRNGTVVQRTVRVYRPHRLTGLAGTCMTPLSGRGRAVTELQQRWGARPGSMPMRAVSFPLVNSPTQSGELRPVNLLVSLPVPLHPCT